MPGSRLSGRLVFITPKERDAETGLDFFEARYYSSAQGRFTSPDEFNGGFLDAFSGQAVFQPGPLPYADITDPQTLNKYAYVRNNPLRYTDPDGHDPNDAVEAVVDFFSGAGRGIAASASFGTVGAPSSSDSISSRLGQAVGTGLAFIGGDAISKGGAAFAVVTAETGVGAVAGAGVAVAGAAIEVGAAKNVGAIFTTPIEKRGQGPSAGTSAGTTASGQATDKQGNKLGPSSKPEGHSQRFNTKKGAREAAERASADGKTRHDAAPADGRGAHYHPNVPKKKGSGSDHSLPS